MKRITLLFAPLLISSTTLFAQDSPAPTQDIPSPQSSQLQTDVSAPTPTTAGQAIAGTEYYQSSNSNYACDGCDGVGQSMCGGNCGDGGQFKLRGWIDAGAIWNTDDPTSNFNGPYNAVDRATEPMLNQIYLIGERTLPVYGIGLGGRVDFLYGEDYFLAESIGMEKRDDGSAHWNPEYYGLAIPQAYVSVGNEVASVQVGHFYSVVGYEGVMAPDNFFYSKAYSYQFAGPFTHWGIQGNVKLNQSWSVQLGVHNGWDALDRVSDDLGFIGKVRWDSRSSDVWSSFAITTGKEYNNGGGLPIADDFTNRTRYSWLVSLPVTCRMEYVFHHWLGFQQRGALDGGQADWYGIDQYLFYKINECWKTGLRFEWFRDEEGTRVGLNRPSNPNDPPFVGNFFSLSLGVNWSPTYNFMLRPEVRYDWYDGNAARLPFNDGADDDQFMLGLDAILLF